MSARESPISPHPTHERITTRDAILAAAIELFAERGYHATSMREIAAAVPLRAAGIYYWFENKHAILLHLEHSFLDELSASVRAEVYRHADPAHRLAAAVREHVHFHGLNPRAAFVTDSELRALSPEARLEVQAKRDAYQTMFLQIVRDGVREGVFTTSDAKIATYAILLASTSVDAWFDPAGSRSIDQVATIHVELVLGSLFVARPTIEAALDAVARPVEPRTGLT